MTGTSNALVTLNHPKICTFIPLPVFILDSILLIPKAFYFALSPNRAICLRFSEAHS